MSDIVKLFPAKVPAAIRHIESRQLAGERYALDCLRPDRFYRIVMYGIEAVERGDNAIKAAVCSPRTPS